MTYLNTFSFFLITSRTIISTPVLNLKGERELTGLCIRVHWQAVLREEKPYNRPKSRGPPRGEACRRQRGHVQVGLLAADHSRASEEQFECESVRV